MSLKESWAQEIFQRLVDGQRQEVMYNVLDDAEWIFVNPYIKSTILSDTYHGPTEYWTKAEPIYRQIFRAPMKFTLRRLSVVGNLAFGELKGETVGKKDNEKYIMPQVSVCLVLEFNPTNEEEDGGKPRCKGVTEYLDSALLQKFMDNNL
ncbi:uncharacterized protein IL334_001279 [Kwoniella shivajii]|uniref:Uncharacterized protein n=1 Tax=Kwoniella shivajii TaxID=564305 RepID=A0ABZ1CVP9_9TREE|nr:hypothetical protein IL334_001279 [Kwoniella shivajii]